MGSISPSGVKTSPQKEISINKSEHFPPIPESLLKLSPLEFQKQIAIYQFLLDSNYNSLRPNPKLKGKLETSLLLFLRAKEVVERNIAAGAERQG